MLKNRIPQVQKIPQHRNSELKFPKYRKKNGPIPQYRKPQCPPHFRRDKYSSIKIFYPYFDSAYYALSVKAILVSLLSLPRLRICFVKIRFKSVGKTNINRQHDSQTQPVERLLKRNQPMRSSYCITRQR